MRTHPSHSGIDQLARTARRLLADGEQMTLLINGIGRLAPGNPIVTLHERDGRPGFLCEPGSPVTAAARAGCSALLTIDGREPDGRQVTLFLTGRLAPGGVDVVDDDDIVDLVALPLERILLEYAPDDDRPLGQYEIPLEVYERAEPGLRPVDIAPIVAHMNAGHQLELCRYLARRHDRPEEMIAGADLVRLDEVGASINWVDPDGAHTTFITFALPARTVGEVGARLRQELLG